MSGPHPSVAAVRVAVRAALADLTGVPIGVAFSGGTDSTALLAAACFAHRAPVVALVVDQDWYDGSAAAARRAARVASGLGAEPVVLVAPAARDEAAARRARYAVLDETAATRGLGAVLLGHTRDDQAETVLLGLTRGSGARSLAGMAPVRDHYRRPLLALPRATTAAACAAQGLEAYADPANSDPAFRRVRIRRDVLPALGAATGGDVRANLARTARLLRDDADLLDELAAAALESACALPAGCSGAGRDTQPGSSLDAAALAALPAAIRRRVLHRWATTLGGAPNSAHVDALDALLIRWRGQGAVSLPGGSRVVRRSGRIAHVPAASLNPALPSVPAGVSQPEAALPPGIVKVLITEDQIRARVAELAAEIDKAHRGHEIVLVAVLKGAVMVVADLSRALTTTASLEFMAVSSYGAATSSSGVVRILKDLDRDIAGKHVVIVEDIVDSGLTLSWLVRYLQARHPASLDVCTLLRKPEAVAVAVTVRWVGFDLGPEFVVGYGLDYAERYRGLPYVGLLDPAAGA